MSSPIEDYAMIGDCHTAALIGRDGSVDWLCLPRFDSGACFAALLGTEKHGRWIMSPASKINRIRRRYREGTLVLETHYDTEDGAVTLIDCMPVRSEEPNLVRLVVGLRGEVRMRMQLIIRFDYGSIVPWVRRTDEGIRAVAGPDSLLLHTKVDLHGEDLTTTAEFTVTEGQRIPFVMQWHPAHKPPPAPIDAEETIAQTNQWWREWSSRCSYEGPWREAVVRSLITLKALIYAPTGGIVAAPTTSLPEQLGGARNWDYRYCWLRDATFTLYALMLGGYTEEAQAWREWLLRSIAGSQSQLNVLYGLAGERRLTEIEIGWLPGYEGSPPVRIGNTAHQQFQLDVYGEVLDALHLARRRGPEPDENAWRVQRALVESLESNWSEPDDGMWEVRGPRQHFTHSKVMAWVALDRMVKTAENFGLEGPIERWRKLRAEIHDEVCRKGFDSEQNAFVQCYGGRQLDSSLLRIPLVGFLPPTDSRVRGTVEAIERHLMRDGLVARHANKREIDGLGPDDIFLPCSFWLADNLALLGRRDDAQRLFERLLDLRNDVGLLSEEYDSSRRRLLGNFPQAFTHVSLVNTAENLSRVMGPARDRQQRS
jgi:GH15 family glucan-1,4-alpha-glucosidase